MLSYFKDQPENFIPIPTLVNKRIELEKRINSIGQILQRVFSGNACDHLEPLREQQIIQALYPNETLNSIMHALRLKLEQLETELKFLNEFITLLQQPKEDNQLIETMVNEIGQQEFEDLKAGVIHYNPYPQ